MRRAGNGTVGSNPTLSATKQPPFGGFFVAKGLGENPLGSGRRRPSEGRAIPPSPPKKFPIRELFQERSGSVLVLRCNSIPLFVTKTSTNGHTGPAKGGSVGCDCLPQLLIGP